MEFALEPDLRSSPCFEETVIKFLSGIKISFAWQVLAFAANERFFPRLRPIGMRGRLIRQVPRGALLGKQSCEGRLFGLGGQECRG